MNAQTTITVAPADDITTFLGKIPEGEYEQRRRIRTYRNAASYKTTLTECSTARSLCWMAVQAGCSWIYTPAEIDDLTSVANFMRRLLILADQAEEIGAP